MGLTQFIDFRYFLISLAIGLFFVYLTQYDKQKIVIMPNPDNVGRVQYQDKADNCFSYDIDEVPCKGNEKKYEIQV